MKVALTGATGFIGSHVLTDLYKHGHEVTALVRDDDQADVVAARGATPTVVDLYDRPAVVRIFGDADGAIHTASPGDATSADLDSAVVDAAIDAYAGTGKPYIEISGLWVYGANTSITEESPFQAPALVAWKEPIERRVLGVKDMRGVGGRVRRRLRRRRRRDSRATSRLAARRPGQLDHARHRTTALADGPRCRPRRLLPPRIGTRRGPWLLRHRQWIEPDRRRTHRGGRRRSRRSRAVPGSDEEARKRLGDYFAEVLLLDQGTTAAKARTELDWSPSHPGLVEEFRHGSYRN